MSDYSKYFPAGQAQSDYSGYFPPSNEPAPKVAGAVDLGAGGMKTALSQAAQEAGPMGAALAGVGTRVNDAAMRLKQIFGNELSVPEIADVKAGRQLRDVSTPAMLGGIGGEVAMTYPLAPKTILGNVATGGAVGGLINPVLPGESTMGNVVQGGAAQGAGAGVMKGLGIAAQPIRQSAPVRALVDEGIIPTIGQAARATKSGIGKFIGSVEDAATSIPGLGSLISGARGRAGQELQEAAIARATPKGVDPIKGVGREVIEETSNAVSDAYGVALDRIGTVKLDTQFLNSAPQIVQRAVALNPQQKADVANVVEQVISSRVNPAGGIVDARIAKTIDSDLGSYVREFSRSSQASERQAANVIREIQSQWRELITRNAPDAETATMLKDANRAFANLLRVEKAATKGTSAGGEFSAAQLNQSVRELTPNKRNFAKGNALMQDLSDPAAQVLTGRLGESGTVPRGLIGLGLLGGGGAYANEQAGGPNWITNAAIAAGMLGPLYTRGGSRYAIGDLSPTIQNALRLGLEQAAPYGGILARSSQQSRE